MVETGAVRDRPSDATTLAGRIPACDNRPISRTACLSAHGEYAAQPVTPSTVAAQVQCGHHDQAPCADHRGERHGLAQARLEHLESDELMPEGAVETRQHHIR
nr:hypothetical protein GCM10020092_052380 [Actinoplanes digitatis]